MGFPLGDSRADAHARGEEVWNLYRRSGVRAPLAAMMAMIASDIAVFALQETEMEKDRCSADGSEPSILDITTVDEMIVSGFGKAEDLMRSD